MKTVVPNQLTIVCIANDNDFVMYEFVVGDGLFAGTVEVYDDGKLPRTLAKALDGFPARIGDSRAIEFGSPSERIAGGWIHIDARCTDSRGRSILSVRLDGKSTEIGSPPRTASVFLSVLASDIDDFVASLSKWDSALGSAVSLRRTAG